VRIGLEIDGVIADLYGAAVKAFGPPRVPGARTLPEMFADISDTAFDNWLQHDTTYLHMPMVARADEGMIALNGLGYSLYIVTERPKHLIQVTAKWLADRNIRVDRIIHVQNKSITASSLALDCFIDHDPNTIREINLPRYLFSQPYNKSRFSFGERVIDWEDLLMRIKKYA